MTRLANKTANLRGTNRDGKVRPSIFAITHDDLFGREETRMIAVTACNNNESSEKVVWIGVRLDREKKEEGNNINISFI